MSLLTKVILQNAMKEDSLFSDEQLQAILRKKLGLPVNNQEGGSGSKKR